MRQIGIVPQGRDAQRLADYLLTLGIRSRVDAQDSGSAIWVYEEDQRTQAQSALEEFLKNPADPRYDEAARQARALERANAAQERQYRKNAIDMRSRWDNRGGGRRPITVALVSISCGVALFMGFGAPASNIVKLSELWITPVVVFGNALSFLPISATLRGEWWRLITPIFIHMSAVHLLFNMFATFDLGSLVEFRIGSLRTAGLVVVIAVLSNLGEYFWDAYRGMPPYFGGMSGVAYGLFGYIWIRGRLDPMSGFLLSSGTVMMMLFWFFLCFTPAMSNIANGVHAVGLVTGMFLAYAPHAWRGLRN
jgi:GlpG protein